MQIIPIRDLKNTTEVERRCAEEGGPVYVTKNGYGRLVVMEIEYYEHMIRKMYEAKLLMEGVKDENDGLLRNGDSVMDNMREQYDL